MQLSDTWIVDQQIIICLGCDQPIIPPFRKIRHLAHSSPTGDRVDHQQSIHFNYLGPK